MIGIRQLRADLAAHVRRAAGGETTVISIGGSPAAPPPGDERKPAREAHLSSLVAPGR
jgi:antitoxin (DNA-binding transcriptional repressor) of toxin-antitoxin stability system